MSILDADWQQQCIRKYGAQYTNPVEVEKQYQDIVDTAYVLGRPDLAKELSVRVTPEMCRKYAALLKVLRLLARDPLHQPLPALYAFNGVEPDVRSEWRQLLTPEEDLQEWSFDDDFQESDVSLELEGEDQPKTPAEPEQADHQLIHDSDESSRATVLHLGTKYAIRDNLSPYRPKFLSSTDFIQDLSLTLLGLPAEDGQLKGITTKCSQSIRQQFREISSAIHIGTSGAPFSAALYNSRSKRCTTVIQMLVEAEILAHDQRKHSLKTNLDSLQRLIMGDINLWPITETQLFDLCPLQFRHPNLYRTCIYGYLIRNLYHRTAPLIYPLKSVACYYQQLGFQYVFNGTHLMDCGFKQCLLNAWDKMSSIYLAQDPRMLLFLDLRLETKKNTSGYVNPNTVLLQVWPDAGFHFDHNGIPDFTLELPDLLVQVFGHNLCQIFEPRALEDVWFEVVNAFEYKIQEVELQMASTARQVRSNIQSGLIPTIYFPIK